MREWIEYDGSDEQLKMLLTAKGKFIVGRKMSIFKKPTSFNMVSNQENLDWLRKHFADYKITRFLICKPHPYADLIKIWADTGCPVYAKHKVIGQSLALRNAQRIDWNSDEWEFSLTPFEE